MSQTNKPLTTEPAKCEICGEPMPPGEQMFKFHGYSGDCPKPPLPKPMSELDATRAKVAALEQELARVRELAMRWHDLLAPGFGMNDRVRSEMREFVAPTAPVTDEDRAWARKAISAAEGPKEEA